MTKLLLSSVSLGVLTLGLAINAGAADLPRAPVYKAPEQVWTWTGFYIGGHFGAGWGDKHWYRTDFSPVIDQGFHHVRGGLAGGQVGFNYQVANWVIGAELDASWADLNGSHADKLFIICTAICNLNAAQLDRSKVDSVGTVAGRLGYAVDRVLGYVKGGGAWAHDKYSISSVLAPDAALATASETRWGWMAGVGIEYAFAPSWSLKFEYDHLDLGTKRSRFTGPSFTSFDEDISQRLNLFKFGINYRFGGYGPVYAKY
jgi:outer membrane immunogenic protein